jgi:hypothetical protein
VTHLTIKFEDLFAICTKCKGTGFVKEEPCEVVSPDPAAPSHGSTCAICGGKGGELTDSGLAIKQLMEKIEAGA